MSWNANFYFRSEIYFNFFLDIYLHVNCLSHSVTQSLLSTVVIHRMLMLISSANLQWCMAMWPCNSAMLHGQQWYVCHWIMMNVTWQCFDQSAKQLAVGHMTVYDIARNSVSWLTLPRGVLSTSWCCLSRPCVVFLACVHLALFLALSLSPDNSFVFS